MALPSSRPAVGIAREDAPATAERGGHADADLPGDLAAAVQRLANWAGAAVLPSPATVVTIARRLEIAAHAQVGRAVQRVREEGQDWTAVASLLGLDALPCHVDDPAQLLRLLHGPGPAAGL
jgi:sirohydrochlorin ferrochelatase